MATTTTGTSVSNPGPCEPNKRYLFRVWLSQYLSCLKMIKFHQVSMTFGPELFWLLFKVSFLRLFSGNFCFAIYQNSLDLWCACPQIWYRMFWSISNDYGCFTMPIHHSYIPLIHYIYVYIYIVDGYPPYCWWPIHHGSSFLMLKFYKPIISHDSPMLTRPVVGVVYGSQGFPR